MTPNTRIRIAWQASGLTRYQFGEAMGLPLQKDSRGQPICKTLNNWLAEEGTTNYRPAPEAMARLAESIE